MAATLSVQHYRDRADRERKQKEIKCYTEKRKQLNKDYEEALMDRQQREYIGFQPTATSTPQAVVDVQNTHQVDLLKQALKSILYNEDQIDRFVGGISMNSVQAINQSITDIENKLPRTPVDDAFFKNFVIDYFRQKGLREQGMPTDQGAVSTGTQTDTTTTTETGTDPINTIDHMSRDELLAEVTRIYGEKYGQDVRASQLNYRMVRFWHDRGAADDVGAMSVKQLKKILTWEQAQGAAPPSTEKRSTGTGLPKKRNIFRKIGRGIEENKTPRLYQFGKYLIHIPFLRKGLLTIKHHSGTNVAHIPRIHISKEMQNFIMDVVENKKINPRLYQTLEKKEKALFQEVVRKCAMEETLNLGGNLIMMDEGDDEYDRFLVLQGEIQAGNDSPELLREFRGCVLRYMKDGTISRLQGMDLLSEIAILV
jgi:hypothetical protein